MNQRVYRLELSWKQSMGKRENQEDNAGIYWNLQDPSEAAKGMMVVVADGMGGMERGEVYSALAKETMLSYFRDHEPTDDMCHELQSAYGAAREAALAAREQQEESDGGSTVVAAIIRDNRFAFLSVGDSRICLLRGEGLIQLNREHTLGVVLDERAAFGYIPQEMADLNTRRKTLTNHLNIENPQPCDLCSHPIDLVPGDKIVLMSDGVFGTIDDDTLTEILLRPDARYADEVLAAVKRVGKKNQDNSTIAVISVYEDMPETRPDMEIPMTKIYTRR